MKTFLLFVTIAFLLAAAIPRTLLAQNSAAEHPLADISIANMNGGNGQRTEVIDPSSPEHAMKIDGTRVQGNIFGFQDHRRRDS
jgi:hypothetical protein